MTRRTVRVDQQFLAELDVQLGEPRGPNGEPSASDFLLIELPTIAEMFGERFDELSLVGGEAGACVSEQFAASHEVGVGTLGDPYTHRVAVGPEVFDDRAGSSVQ